MAGAAPHQQAHKLRERTALSRLRWRSGLALILCLALATLRGSLVAAGRLSQIDQAERLLQSLSPEERVGQLFLVSFQGMRVDEETPIYDLIVNHHVGGVVLTAANDNFIDSEDIAAQILNMNRQLQLNRWAASQKTTGDEGIGEGTPPTFIPLFIGISQEGDGYNTDQILSGVTQLPNSMAMGATWNPELVANVGAVLGQELSALGINLLFGPSLDVLGDPQPMGGVGLGTRSFGGDPYWVGKLGQKFIESVHRGSNGKIAVIAKHFPGIGSADRLPTEEVATVRKSLEELQNFDLAPFFSVTGNSATLESTADGLLVSHIRYQGFQGNIRATTRPISLDLQAFSQLMSLPSLTTWRATGGVMVCDDLGSQAVRRFYEVTAPNQPFDARRVVLNAFLAGNDLIQLGNLVSSDAPDSYTTTLNILAFFNQRYRDDPEFAQRVDEAALRILRLKMRLYPVFNLDSILPPLDGVATLGMADQIAFNVEKEAATLISPSLAELENALPDAPGQNDRIVFITDVRNTRQCSQCPVQEIPAVDSFQKTVMRLYGTQAGGQIRAGNLISYTFEDLQKMLDRDESAFQMEIDLRRAQWQVITLLDVGNRQPTSLALYRYLSERPDLFQQKRLVVFAFNAPYFLDATDISKLTAYFGLYSKIPAAFDVAARLLFKEIQPHGALPVSVEGVGYDLISATMPDPNQVIRLELDLPQAEPASGTATPEAAPTPVFQPGERIPVKTGVILDHNGHPVPDGTPVQFIVSRNGEIQSLPQVVYTSDGVASSLIQVPGPGALEIRVESEPAKQSDILRFDIPGGETGATTQTPTPEPSPTPTPSPSPPPTPTILPVGESQTPPRPGLLEWLTAIAVATGSGLAAFRLAVAIGQVRWGVRSGFLAVIGGLALYSGLVIGEAISKGRLDTWGVWGVILATLAGSGLGVAAAWGWKIMLDQRVKDRATGPG